MKFNLGIRNHTAKKKTGRPPSKKSGIPSKDESYILPDNPFVLTENLSEANEVKTSKTGRVIKPPKRLMMLCSTLVERKENDEEIIKLQQSDNESDDENYMVPDPDWFPESGKNEDGIEEHGDDEATYNDDDDDDDEEDADYEIDEAPITTRKRRKKSIPPSKRKSKKRKIVVTKTKKDLAPPPVKRRRRRKNDNPQVNTISIKVVLPSGEEVLGCYVKDETDDNKITPGSVIPQSDNLPGVRIICPENRCNKMFRFVDKMHMHVKKVHQGAKFRIIDSSNNFCNNFEFLMQEYPIRSIARFVEEVFHPCAI